MRSCRENEGLPIARTKQTAHKTACSPSQKHFAHKTCAVQRPHRFRPGVLALREIRKYQRSTALLIQRTPFQRLIKSISYEFNSSLRFTTSSLQAIQEAAEYYLVGLFEDSQLCALHARRVTVMTKDLQRSRLSAVVYNGRLRVHICRGIKPLLSGAVSSCSQLLSLFGA